MTSPLPAPPPKPRLRGVSHQVAFFITLAAGVGLLAWAPNATSRWGALVYVASLATLFGVSALYHRPTWSPAARARMRRLDHAAIFVLIAGTGTPMALSLPEPARHTFLLITWSGAALGVARAVLWVTAPKPLVAVLALALGWAVTPFVADLHHAVGTPALVLVALGGVFYSAGAVVYALKRPDPWPLVFGYHEVFHALVIVAAGVHFAAVVLALPAIAPA